MTSPDVAYDSPRGRWILAGAVVGSGIAFLDGTVVNTALPAIGRELHADLASLEWVLSAYLLTLGSLLVLGGSLGDLYGRRRMFEIGLVTFAASSAVCAVAQTPAQLIAARAVQGCAAAVLVPGSLAIIAGSFRAEDRGRAVGAWSGLAGIATAIGPFAGGWLIDSASWRFVFLLNVPLAAVAFGISRRHIPETLAEHGTTKVRIDVPGAATLSGGLGGVVYALIEGSAAAGVVGVVLLVAFVAVETRARHPMVPLALFRSAQFTGANLVTFVVYGALGVGMFLVAVHLQNDLGYSALEAGASFLPLTLMMLVASARMGALAQRVGPRWPMTIGPVVCGAGIALLAEVSAGDHYLTHVLPGVVVLGAGLAITVAPLTATVLAAVDVDHAGIGSAINNAVARVAGLLAIATIPSVVGLDDDFVGGYRNGLVLAAVMSAAGGVIAALTIRGGAAVEPTTHVVGGPSCLGHAELARPKAA